jgi:hypothetical protein
MKASPEPKGALPWKGAGMTPNELGLWVGQLGENAMEVLATRDGGPPTALVVVQGVPIATEMVLAGEEDKALRRAYFEMAARGGAEACALVAEGWSARISATARPLAARPGLTSLAEVAGRREVLIIHAVSPQGGSDQGVSDRASARPGGPRRRSAAVRRRRHGEPLPDGAALGAGGQAPALPAEGPECREQNAMNPATAGRQKRAYPGIWGEPLHERAAGVSLREDVRASAAASGRRHRGSLTRPHGVHRRGRRRDARVA